MFQEYVIPPRHLWPAPIQTVLGTVPASADVQATKFGEVPVTSGHSWFYPALGLLALIGYGSATFMAIVGAIVGAIAVALTVGAIIGVLLAFYRDYRGTVTSPPQIAGLTAAAAGGLVFLARESFGAGELIQAFVFLWLGSTIPILVGFFAARWAIARRGSATTHDRIEQSPTEQRRAELSPDLRAATDRGRAVALVRLYAPGEGAALEEDRAALEPWGYDLRKQVTARLETSSTVLRAAESVLPGVALGEEFLWAVFVRRFGAPT